MFESVAIVDPASVDDPSRHEGGVIDGTFIDPRFVAVDDLLPEGGSVAAFEPRALRSDELSGLLPGPDLAYLLEGGSVEGADDHGLVEAVAAWQRVVAWAAAGAALAAAELADRASMNPAWPRSAGAVCELNVAGEELAMRLGCSRAQARALVRDGRAYRGVLAATGEALGRGEIDVPRARVLVVALQDAPVPLALDVQEAVLPGAAGRTPAQLGRDVARALIVADPAGARQRHQVARCRRRVERPRFLADEMAGMWAVLPAVDAVRLDAGIDVLARSARTAGDLRTLDQLRADLLVDLTLGRFDGSQGQVRDGFVEATGEGPDPQESRPGGAGDRGTGGVGDGGAGLVRRSRVSPRSQIRVTVPLTSLLGLSADPADLAGYGPITAEAAACLARDGTWRRIVTDPVNGQVLDVGRTRYRPPADLAEHVRARDRFCARPGCSTRAESCDLDHTVDYGRDLGRTSHDNLAPLCPRDHTVKTDGGFTLAQIAPGIFEWRTPTGHHYRVIPGTDSPVQRPDRHARPTRGSEGPGADPPPF